MRRAMRGQRDLLRRLLEVPGAEQALPAFPPWMRFSLPVHLTVANRIWWKPDILWDRPLHALDPRVFAVRRISPDGTDRVLCLHNVSDETAPVPAASWGGAGTVSRLSPYEVLWLEGI